MIDYDDLFELIDLVESLLCCFAFAIWKMVIWKMNSYMLSASRNLSTTSEKLTEEWHDPREDICIILAEVENERKHKGVKQKQYNCPNCGAPVTGDRCEYCGTVF